MSGATMGPDLVVRPFQDVDEREVLELLRGSLGGGPAGERTAEYFRWKHVQNPFGRSFMTVGEIDGRIVGFRALMRWRFRIGDRTIEAVRPVDTATAPEYRGRGVFSSLTAAALDSLRGEIDLVFNTPNPDSLRGYLKLGWQVVGEVPVSVRVCRPFRLLVWRLRGAGAAAADSDGRPSVSAPTAAEALADEAAVAGLIERSETVGWGYATPRTVDYLRWRYAEVPLLGYHAVRLERDGRLAGLAFFRPRREGSLWGFTVAELIVAAGDLRTARGLLAATRRAGNVAYVATVFPEGTAASRASRGPMSMRAPRKPTLVANPLRKDLRPDPLLLSSWALSTCDVEVF